jgi:hypothetical protein
MKILPSSSESKTSRARNQPEAGSQAVSQPEYQFEFEFEFFFETLDQILSCSSFFV